MALTKPQLYNVAAFDATEDFTFTFNVVGGSQVVGNRLTIRNNTTNVVVYQQVQTTYIFEHTVAADTLTNGTIYNATVETKDNDGNYSTASNTIQFYCYTTPSFAITNMPTGNIVTNANFAFEATYDQDEDEALESYIYTLYNASDVAIATSGTTYTGSTTVPLTLSYTFSGMDNNTVYKIQVTGVTAEGTTIATSLLTFTVSYVNPSVFTLIELTNNCTGGYINVSSNIVSIDGVSNPSPPTYIDNQKIDLRTSGSYVKWVSGFNIANDFTLGLWGEQLTKNTLIATLWNTSDTEANKNRIEIRYNQGYSYGDTTTLKVYAEAWIYSGDNTTPMYIYSNYITEPTKIFVWLRRSDNVYQIKIESKD